VSPASDKPSDSTNIYHKNGSGAKGKLCRLDHNWLIENIWLQNLSRCCLHITKILKQIDFSTSRYIYQTPETSIVNSSSWKIAVCSNSATQQCYSAAGYSNYLTLFCTKYRITITSYYPFIQITKLPCLVKCNTRKNWKRVLQIVIFPFNLAYHTQWDENWNLSKRSLTYSLRLLHFQDSLNNWCIWSISVIQWIWKVKFCL
jgi:hypothetical protein